MSRTTSTIDHVNIALALILLVLFLGLVLGSIMHCIACQCHSNASTTSADSNGGPTIEVETAPDVDACTQANDTGSGHTTLPDTIEVILVDSGTSKAAEPVAMKQRSRKRKLQDMRLNKLLCENCVLRYLRAERDGKIVPIHREGMQFIELHPCKQCYSPSKVGLQVYWCRPTCDRIQHATNKEWRKLSYADRREKSMEVARGCTRCSQYPIVILSAPSSPQSASFLLSSSGPDHTAPPIADAIDGHTSTKEPVSVLLSPPAEEDAASVASWEDWEVSVAALPQKLNASTQANKAVEIWHVAPTSRSDPHDTLEEAVEEDQHTQRLEAQLERLRRIIDRDILHKDQQDMSSEDYMVEAIDRWTQRRGIFLCEELQWQSRSLLVRSHRRKRPERRSGEVFGYTLITQLHVRHHSDHRDERSVALQNCDSFLQILTDHKNETTTGPLSERFEAQARAIFTRIVGSPGQPRLRGKIIHNESDCKAPGFLVTAIRSIHPSRIYGDKPLPGICTLEELDTVFVAPIWQQEEHDYIFAYYCTQRTTFETIKEAIRIARESGYQELPSRVAVGRVLEDLFIY